VVLAIRKSSQGQPSLASSFGGTDPTNAMKPNEKRRAAIAVLGGVTVFCLLLVLLAARELVFIVHRPALVFDPLPSIRHIFCLSLAGTVILAAWVFVVTHRRNAWSLLLDAEESIHVALGLPAKWGRAFCESGVFTVFVSILLGLFVLATVATVVTYFYLKSK